MSVLYSVRVLNIRISIIFIQDDSVRIRNFAFVPVTMFNSRYSFALFSPTFLFGVMIMSPFQITANQTTNAVNHLYSKYSNIIH